MKLTKTLAALGILGAALLTFASCKDTSGDGKITGIIPGVAKKWAQEMTVDATGDNIKVDDEAITDSNETTTDKVVADTPEGKTTAAGHELERQRCGKRFFKEFTSGFNNNEGFRMNIVLSKDGTWTNANVTTNTKPRTATAGVLFDFYEYEKQAGNKTYDFFFLAFKPTITSGTGITGITAYFERYSGVKKYKEGIYSSHSNASALGSNYVPTDYAGAWDSKLYSASAGKSWDLPLQKGKDYKLDNDGNAIIGVDIKQLQNGLYTVSFGNIKYYVGSEEQDFSVTNFKQGWNTKFTPGQTIGKGGDPNGTSSISGYDNWTHISKTDKSTNLKGGVLTYAFAPYGTKPVVNYFICSTSKSSGSTDTQDSGVDYVGDWKVPATLDERPGVTDKIFYEEGNVVHEYIYY